MSTESTETPAKRIADGYAVEGQALELGTVVVDGTADPSAQIRIPLATINRHGLVAGATGTGKTKTLQLIAEQLSAAGVPVLMADVKGDLSGLAKERVATFAFEVHQRSQDDTRRRGRHSAQGFQVGLALVAGQVGDDGAQIVQGD